MSMGEHSPSLSAHLFQNQRKALTKIIGLSVTSAHLAMEQAQANYTRIPRKQTKLTVGLFRTETQGSSSRCPVDMLLL